MSGIGFAIGVERLMIMCEAEEVLEYEKSIDCYVINLNDDRDDAFDILEELRDTSYTSEMDYYKRSLQAHYKSSDRKKARFILIIGEDEVKNNTVTLKDTLTQAQEEVKREELVERIDQLMEDYYE